MNIFLDFDHDNYDALCGHLLHNRSVVEQAAFLFATQSQSRNSHNFGVRETYFADTTDFQYQRHDHLELADSTRQFLIRHAHKTGTCLVESHSHLGPWPAAFSAVDLAGLRSTVDHVWWRLKNRPYIALVFSTSGFDALAWIESPQQAESVTGIRIDDVTVQPTNLSLRFL